MATVPYAYISQPILASALVQQMDDDSFYFPDTNGLTGYAFNGLYYVNGAPSMSPPLYASWYTEGQGPYRGSNAPFPPYGLLLLGRASLTILDESTPQLALWMTFLLHDQLLLTDNFALENPLYPNSPPLSQLQGFLPRGLAYANGIISVTFSPDPGSESITSTMVVNIDFTQDTAYLDVAT